MAYIGKSIESGTFALLDTSGNTYNGSNTTFSLGTQVGSPAQLLVSHDGVLQKPGTDYSLASGGTQITFSTAPASGASIFIVEISGAVGGPLDSDLNGSELILDADGDTSITADTDDQIDIKIAGADDFKFTANTFTAQSGSGVVIPDGGLTLGSTAVSATAAEINLIDGNTARGTTAISDGDGVLINDDGTMRMTNVTTLKTYMAGETNTPGWLATMSSTQSISNATYTTVQFNTESDGYDTDSGFNTSTYTYTVPSGEGGKYFLTAGVYLAANSGHEYIIKFVTSAGDRAETFVAGVNRDTGVTPQTTAIQSLNAGQTAYVQVYQNSGQSKNTSSGIKNCWFGGFKISS